MLGTLFCVNTRYSMSKYLYPDGIMNSYGITIRTEK